MSEEKGAQPPRAGTALTDAVVAALAKVDDQKPAPAMASAAGGNAPGVVAHGSNGFRNGPGSFADLKQQWAGGAPMQAAAKAEPAKAEPPKAEPAKAEPAKAEPAKAEPAKAEPAKAEPAKAEPAKAEPPKAEPAKAEPAKAEPPRADAKADPEPAKVEAEGEAAKEKAETEEAAPGKAKGTGITVRYHGTTDVGLVREHNEDNYLTAEVHAGKRDLKGLQEVEIDSAGLVFAVCDGMGGAAAGEVASQMAVDTILEVMTEGPPADDRDAFARRVVHAVEEAGHRIFSAAKMDRTRRGMGTTATLAGLVDNILFVGQVGDSRAYVLRGDQLAMVTKDQSLVNQLIEAGQLTEEEAEAFEHSNIILQALGTTEDVTVDLTFLEMRQGDRLMMCSDGLSGLVHDEMIKEVMSTVEDITEVAAKLTQMANAGGGHDNITVILADFEGEPLGDPAEAQVKYQPYPLPPSEEDTARGKAFPQRDPSMKPGGSKPGADVKRDGTGGLAGENEGDSNKMIGMVAIAAILLLAVLAGGFLLFGSSGEGGEANTTQPAPGPAPTEGVEDIVEPPFEDPVEDPIEDPIEDPGTVEAPIEETTGTVTIHTDVEDGALFVNGEPRGELTEGRSLELGPGVYRLEARVGDARVASQQVTVSEGGSVEATLNVPVVEEPTPARETAPTNPRPTGDESESHGRRGRRRGGGTRPGGLPSNPF